MECRDIESRFGISIAGKLPGDNVMNLISISFIDLTSFQLSALLASALFCFMVGLRELRHEDFFGLLYILIGIFFLSVHGYLLWNLPQDATPSGNIGFWQWLIQFLAPALIVLYLVFGAFSLMMARFRTAIIKLFFGLTLICYLFMLGPDWPMDVRGILVLIWSGLWFEVELETAR
jgi:hypothetical protein